MSEYKPGEEYNEIRGENASYDAMASRLRQDFCTYLRRSLPPWRSVQFEVERVEILPLSASNREISTKTIGVRPVIRIYQDQDHITSIVAKRDENGLTRNQVRPMKPSTGEDKNILNQISHDDSSCRVCEPIRKAQSSIDRNKNIVSSYGNNWHGLRTENQESNQDLCRKSFSTVDAIGKHKPNETEISNESRQTHTPVAYVNMELGDLRSVTSFLSAPIVEGEGTIIEINRTRKSVKHETVKNPYPGEYPVLLTAKKIVEERTGRIGKKNGSSKAKKLEEDIPAHNHLPSPRSDYDQTIETPPRTTRYLRAIPPWDLDGNSHGVINNNNVLIHEKHDAELTSNALLNSPEATAESDASEWDDDNSHAKSKTEPADLHGSWGQLLASVCEVIIPASSSNILSSSPIRHFTLSSTKSTASTVPVTDDGHQSSNDQLSEDKTGARNKADGFVDQAKRLGNDLSNQFDELMKIAYNENDHQGAQLDGLQTLTPILEEVPDVLSINTDEDRTFTSCLTSSIVGQPRKNPTPEKNGNLETKNKHLSDERTNETEYAVPISKSFRLPSFSKPEMVLPRRTDDRRGARLARPKQTIARKKTNGRDVSIGNVAPDILSHRRKICEDIGTDCIETHNYNKETRYSSHENRFYS